MWAGFIFDVKEYAVNNRGVDMLSELIAMNDAGVNMRKRQAQDQ